MARIAALSEYVTSLADVTKWLAPNFTVELTAPRRAAIYRGHHVVFSLDVVDGKISDVDYAQFIKQAGRDF